VLAFAKSAEAAVTKKAQEVLTETFKLGLGENEAAKALRSSVAAVSKRTGPWSEAYSRLAFRNNVNTAVTAGRFRAAQDPISKTIAPAFIFDAVGDRDTRDNHNAADGLVFDVDAVEWNKLAPPLGHNCRCSIRLMSRPMLRRMQRLEADGTVINSKLPHDARPDPGFRHGGRPDLGRIL